MCGYCATRGGSRGGGVFGPLGTTVPWGDSPRGGRAAQGPLHPAVTSPPRLCWSCVWFLSGFPGVDVGYSVYFSWSLGLECCLVWCPLGPDPCMPRCWLSSLSLSIYIYISLSLSFVFGIVVGVVLFFLSFSGAGETQTPFGVWDSPCVSSSWPRSPTLTRTPSSAPTPRSGSCACFFFLSSSSFAGMVVVGLGLSGLCLVGGFLLVLFLPL